MIEVKCAVFRPSNMDALYVVLYQDHGDHDLVFSPVRHGERVFWEWVVVEKRTPGVGVGDITPTFILPQSTMKRFGVVQELVDGLYEETGIMTSGLEKVLEHSRGQADHLKDLQRVIFESDFVNIQRGTPQVLMESVETKEPEIEIIPDPREE